jgi:ribosome-binding protein aMBF1 (putative translation factor)
LHESSVARAPICNRPQKSEDESSRDSSNFRAAQLLLQKRLDAGLSQEELASLAGESPRQIGRRERGEVHLGALRLLVVLERAAGVKAVKGTK